MRNAESPLSHWKFTMCNIPFKGLRCSAGIKQKQNKNPDLPNLFVKGPSSLSHAYLNNSFENQVLKGEVALKQRAIPPPILITKGE